ncbi:hypothetical protein BDZ97DRAFT_2077461, partial [Flammula alnicola]
MSRCATQAYGLYRGRTTAAVEDLSWARDGRWLAVGTRNRAICVFPVNPYGGKSDIRSHMDGRVRNVDIIELHLITLTPLVKLRGSKNASAERPTALLAFMFISPSDVSSSPNLMFLFAPRSVVNSPMFSPPKLKRGANYQGVLVFDPQGGILSLRRWTIKKHLVMERGVSGGVAASVQALGAASVSLPGMGGAGPLSPSPSNKVSATSSKSPTSSGIAELPTELAAKESIEAAWVLKRGRDWVEKMPVQPPQTPAADSRRGGDWLAEGEISTRSTSTRALPRPLYPSHQFSFHTLRGDCHALAVEISAYSSGGGEPAFVESFSSPRDIRRVSSSFLMDPSPQLSLVVSITPTCRPFCLCTPTALLVQSPSVILFPSERWLGLGTASAGVLVGFEGRCIKLVRRFGIFTAYIMVATNLVQGTCYVRYADGNKSSQPGATCSRLPVGQANLLRKRVRRISNLRLNLRCHRRHQRRRQH